MYVYIDHENIVISSELLVRTVPWVQVHQSQSLLDQAIGNVNVSDRFDPKIFLSIPDFPQFSFSLSLHLISGRLNASDITLYFKLESSIVKASTDRQTLTFLKQASIHLYLKL